MRQSTKQIGDAGESLATQRLQGVGYLIVDRNFRTRFGEIDIIAKDGNDLVFIEVKTKSNDYFGTAAEMITKRKLEKIIKTAETYILANKIDSTWRIDAVLINGNEVEIIQNISV